MFDGALTHLHTVLTDGELEVDEYFDFALKHGVPRIIFLEHVRREPTYDLRAFAARIREAGRHTGVDAKVGFEAKILPDGELDLSEEAWELADVVGMAEHGRPPEGDEVFHRYRQAICRNACRIECKPVIWVHPGLWLRRASRLEESWNPWLEAVRSAREAGFLIERNLRYDLLPELALSELGRDRVVIGADAHRTSDLDRWLAARGAG